jgi:predicted enzyme related to lactoylglutathione lyase
VGRFEAADVSNIQPKETPMEANPSTINWFEIPVTDFARAKAFYEAVLETTIQTVSMG